MQIHLGDARFVIPILSHGLDIMSYDPEAGISEALMLMLGMGLPLSKR